MRDAVATPADRLVRRAGGRLDYYPSFAITHGLPHGTAQLLVGVVLTSVAASVLVHGVSVTPLLKLYRKAGV